MQPKACMLYEVFYMQVQGQEIAFGGSLYNLTSSQE